MYCRYSLTVLGSFHNELLAIALTLAVIAKNGYFFASLTLSLRTRCEPNLSISDAKKFLAMSANANAIVKSSV